MTTTTDDIPQNGKNGVKRMKLSNDDDIDEETLNSGAEG
jgi:hypothetical protein